jgi:PhzF family phenazine biosynthesis protein
MVETQLSIVDAFTDSPFTGNPAAVVTLTAMPTDEWMQALARELNVSDTAFVVAAETDDADFGLRWFTPVTEVDLCGHATLAAAHCLLPEDNIGRVRFSTNSGVLTVMRELDGSLAMDFPANPPAQMPACDGLEDALGVRVVWTGRGANDQILAVVESEPTVRAITPDLTTLSRIEVQAIIVSAAAAAEGGHDFVSRVFAPRVGIPEDPVTGSAHTVLAPYWYDRLGRQPLVGLQASARPGYVGVTVNGDRVVISGRAVTVLDGTVAAAARPTD